MGRVSDYLRHHYRHFNAAVVVDAADAWDRHLSGGGRMLVTLGGAMSTAELGLSLAELIRQKKVHAISCTGANLEEDVFNLVAHSKYERVPRYRELSRADERALCQRGMNRVTDTCIPEEAAMRKIESHVLERWRAAAKSGERYFPHEYLFQLLNDEVLADDYEIDPSDSWLIEAAKRDLPVFVPGWEDSTLGNMFVAAVSRGDTDFAVMRSGPEYMERLIDWYTRTDQATGFFQIGGGIAGDFPICVVPLLHQDLKRPVPMWQYFCQISDSTTSFGSYSGAVPNEKISWGKLDEGTPSFIIESDATIVFPLLAALLLDD